MFLLLLPIALVLIAVVLELYFQSHYLRFAVLLAIMSCVFVAWLDDDFHGFLAKTLLWLSYPVFWLVNHFQEQGVTWQSIKGFESIWLAQKALIDQDSFAVLARILLLLHSATALLLTGLYCSWANKCIIFLVSKLAPP